MHPPTLSWKTKDGGLGGFLETASSWRGKTSHQQVRGVLFTLLPPVLVTLSAADQKELNNHQAFQHHLSHSSSLPMHPHLAQN